MKRKSLKLKEQKGAIIAEAKKFRDSIKDRDLTAEESAKVETLVKNAEALDTEIVNAEAQEANLAKLDAMSASNGPEIVLDNGTQAEEMVRKSSIKVSLPFRKGLKAFSENENGVRDAYLSGMMLRSKFLPEGHPLKAEAQAFCREHSDSLFPNAATMSGTVNASGGYLVPDPLAASVIETAEKYGVIRSEMVRNGTIWPMPSDTLTVPLEAGAVTVYSPGQGSAITASLPTFGAVALSAKTLAALIQIPNELLADSVINLADYVARKSGEALAAAEDDCGFNGDGTATYFGFVGIRTTLVDGNHAASLITAATGADDTIGELDDVDLYTCQGALNQRWEANARWYVHKRFWSNCMVRLMRAAGGVTAAEIAMAKYKMYGGDEVVIAQKMPGSLTTDYSSLVMALYGDIGAGLAMGQRGGIEVARSTERYFDSNMTAIRVTERVDITPAAVGDSTTSGALIGLQGGAS